MKEDRHDGVFEVRWVFGVAILLDAFMLSDEGIGVVEVGVDAFLLGFGVVRVVAKQFARPPMQIPGAGGFAGGHETVQEIPIPDPSDCHGGDVVFLLIAFIDLGQLELNVPLPPSCLWGEVVAAFVDEFI